MYCDENQTNVGRLEHRNVFVLFPDELSVLLKVTYNIVGLSNFDSERPSQAQGVWAFYLMEILFFDIQSIPL